MSILEWPEGFMWRWSQMLPVPASASSIPSASGVRGALHLASICTRHPVCIRHGLHPVDRYIRSSVTAESTRERTRKGTKKSITEWNRKTQGSSVHRTSLGLCPPFVVTVAYSAWSCRCAIPNPRCCSQLLVQRDFTNCRAGALCKERLHAHNRACCYTVPA
jgi:hypothetical protein